MGRNDPVEKLRVIKTDRAYVQQVLTVDTSGKITGEQIEHRTKKHIEPPEESTSSDDKRWHGDLPPKEEGASDSDSYFDDVDHVNNRSTAEDQTFTST